MILFLLIFFLAPRTYSQDPVVAQDSSRAPIQEMVVDAKPLDPRALILRDYFIKYDSPLADNAQDFIDAADTYKVDWKLVPSIAGVESTFGKVTPGGYNCWGWGVYGNQAIYFTSMRDGIFTVTKGIRENYIDKGLDDPYKMNYAYASSTAWGGHVDFFLQDLSTFAQSYSKQAPTAMKDVPGDSKVAATSANLSQANSAQVPNGLILALKP